VADAEDFNTRVIREFRENGGKVGPPFEGADMILLTHKGAKSGVERTTPLVTSEDNGKLIVIASAAGAPKHPDWYHNLVANPEITVEHGTDTFQVRAVEQPEPERRRLYDKQAEIMPGFKEYEAKTDRVIPVFVLEPID
jgi:deazaflavin-dependent oxidoreductase (nitroreductase family)